MSDTERVDPADDSRAAPSPAAGRGCARCVGWLNGPGDGELVKLADCKDAFDREGGGYFSADLFWCPSCGATWLRAYKEVFDDEDPMAEWGARTWVYETLDSSQVHQIYEKRGEGKLLIESFRRA